MSSELSVAVVDPAISASGSIIDEGPLVNRQLVMAHLAAGIGFLALALLAGFLYGLQFTGLYPFRGIEFLSPGRVHFVHTNTLIYGFMANMFAGGLYWVIPRTTRRRVFNGQLGWLLFGLWNFIVVYAIVGLLAGYAQGVEWGETPNGLASLVKGDTHIFFVDELMIVGLLLMAVQFLIPLALTSFSRPMYVSGWFISVGLVWGLLLYIIGNYFPELDFFPGTAGAVFAGIFMHGIIALFIAPLSWGLMYYFVPAITKKPIWSYGVSVLGFWGLAFFSPLGGLRNFIYGPIPMFAQYLAVIATVAGEVIVLTLAVNFFMTLRGRESYLRTSIAVRYFYTGLLFYVIASLQGAMQTQFWIQEYVHLTDWEVGHTYLLLYGVFGFWVFGALVDLWPRVSGKPSWYSRGASEWVYWLNVAAVLGMFLSLTAGGLAEGFMWQNLSTWENMLNSLQWPWRFFNLSLVIAIFANSLLIFNMLMTALPTPVRAMKYAKPAQIYTAVGD